MPRISDIAFTPAVKAWQDRHGSRGIAGARDFFDTVTDDLRGVLARCNSFYLASVSETGHPYIQHRGGPRGFLRVLDERTLGFADLTGNRQYITAGNLDGNDRVHLFLMDYANKSRIKIWGRARMSDDPADIARLAPGDGRADRAVLIRLDAWDVNCPRHIPDLYGEDIVRAATAKLMRRIAELEAECADLRGWLGKS